jgi:acyl carrier protein|tara:strand:- start:59 stop:301 length:243 start_codon:yes stop_codon:yes gene_type:complete
MTSQEILDIVAQMIIGFYTKIELADVTPNSSFVEDFNFDSMDSIELVLQLEVEFDIQINDEDIDNIHIVQDVIELVQNNI